MTASFFRVALLLLFSTITVNAQSNDTGAPLPNIDPSGVRNLCPGPHCPISLEPNPFDCLPNCSVEPVNPVVDALRELGDKIKLEMPIGDDTVIGVEPKPKEPGVFIRVGPKQKPDEIPEPTVTKILLSELSPVALSWGDPHITTIDGLAYDFQAVGEFVKLRSKVDNFEVQVRQEPWRNSTDLSQNTAVAVNLHGMRVGIYTNGISEFVINGEPILGTKIQRKFNTGGAIERNGNEFELRWVDGSKLDVKVYPDSHLDIKIGISELRRAKVEGLLGNYDGNAGNDLTSRDGRVVRQTLKHGPELYDIFGDSWRISNEESLFAYQPGQSTETFTIKGFPSRYLGLRDFDQQSVQKAKEICLAKGIPSGPMLDGCTFDVAATGEDAFAESAAALLGVTNSEQAKEPAKLTATKTPATCISTDAITRGGSVTKRGGGFCGYSCSQVMSLYDGVLGMINRHYFFKYPGKPDTSLKEWYEAELIPSCCTGGVPLCR